MTGTDAVQLDLLGPLRVRVDDRPVEISTPRLRTVLVRLALDVGRAVSVDRLIDDLWPVDPPAGALGSLRSYLSQLRGQLATPDLPGDALIVTHGRGYALEVPAEALDTVRFEQALASARAAARDGDADAALELFAGASELWRGDALADVRDEPFARPEITRLEELRLGALEDRCEVLLQAGRHVEAVADLEALTAASPHRERPRAQLMLALHRSGRSTDALRIHREYRAALADEQGLDPGPAIEELADRILRQDPALLRSPASPSVARAGRPAVSAAALRPHGTGLAGRASERDALGAAIADAAAGEGRCLLLAGEPGIGKTALLLEMAATAEAAGLPTHWGQCLEVDGAPALWPWREVARSVLSGRDPTDVEALMGRGPARTILQFVDAAGAGDGTGDPDDVDSARFALYQAIITLIARTGPSAIILEDIHWADVHSLHLLGELASRVPQQATVVAASYRDVDPHLSPQLGATIATIARRPGTQILELDGLGAADVTELLSSVTGEAPTDEAVERVMGRTAGNPFFVHQLASLAGDGGDDLDPGAVSVPVGLRHVIDRRVSLLGDDVRTTLTAAAMLGRSFSLPVVATMRGQDLAAVLDDVDRATAHGLVVPEPDTPLVHRFVHSLVRETLYELTPQAQRLRLHAAAAAALDSDGGAPAEQVAEHYWAAVGLVASSDVIDALRRAAAAARGVLAYDQAEEYLRRCLDLLAREPGGHPRVELAVRLELVKLMTSRRGWAAEGVEDVAGRVREIVDEAGIGPDLIPLWWALWNHYFTRGDLETADELAAKLLDDAESHDSPGCRVAGRVASAMMRLHRQGDIDGALAHLSAARESETASPAARLAVTPEHLSVALRTTEATAHALAGDRAAAEQAATEAMDVAAGLDNAFAEAFAGLQAGLVAALDDDPELARARAGAALDQCQRHGFDYLEQVITPLHAWAVGRTGGDADAEIRRAAAAIDELRQRRHHHLLPQWLLLLADLEERAGDDAGAAAHVAESGELATGSGDHAYASRLTAR